MRASSPLLGDNLEITGARLWGARALLALLLYAGTHGPAWPPWRAADAWVFLGYMILLVGVPLLIYYVVLLALSRPMDPRGAGWSEVNPLLLSKRLITARRLWAARLLFGLMVLSAAGALVPSQGPYSYRPPQPLVAVMMAGVAVVVYCGVLLVFSEPAG